MAFRHKHTKGDWAYNPPSEKRPSEVMVSACKGMVNIYKAPLTKETKANAKLIANAPNLLQIAEMFYDHLGGKESIAKIVTGKVLESVGVLSEKEEGKMEEIKVVYNIELIGRFMELYESETGKKIPERIFNKFFNV